MKFRIVIVTRDSAAWIGVIAAAYRSLGMRPLYLVHDKTQDATAEILGRAGEDVEAIALAHDRVEAAIAQFPKLVAEEWVLRMDDDEFPSRRMIAYTKKAVRNTREEAIAYARRDALPHLSPLCYLRPEAMFNAPLLPFHIDPQLRAFRHREAEFRDDIHTPGFVPHSVRAAPVDAFMVHFNTSVRAFSARVAKLARYEAQAPGAGMTSASRYHLPEILSADELRAQPFETREFDELARKLRAVAKPEADTDESAEARDRILAHVKAPRVLGDEERKLNALRDEIAALPTWARALLGTRWSGG